MQVSLVRSHIYFLCITLLGLSRGCTASEGDRFYIGYRFKEQPNGRPYWQGCVLGMLEKWLDIAFRPNEDTQHVLSTWYEPSELSTAEPPEVQTQGFEGSL